MKAQVQFHILPADAGAQDRLQYAAQITAGHGSEKPLAAGAPPAVCILCENAEMSEALDNILWQGEEFLPHYRATALDELPAGVKTAGIVIITAPDYPPACELLINLSKGAADIPKHCKTVIEIVTPSNSAVLTATRSRYRQYQDMGLEPKTEKIQ